MITKAGWNVLSQAYFLCMCLVTSKYFWTFPQVNCMVNTNCLHVHVILLHQLSRLAGGRAGGGGVETLKEIFQVRIFVSLLKVVIWVNDKHQSLNVWCRFICKFDILYWCIAPKSMSSKMLHFLFYSNRLHVVCKIIKLIQSLNHIISVENNLVHCSSKHS